MADRHSRPILRLTSVIAALCVLAYSSQAFAQRGGGGLSTLIGKEGITNRPLFLLAAIAALALIPFLLIMVTSFVKIAVVLSIVRQAIGTQQIPPTQVITGIATVLTIYIMMPVGLEVFHTGKAQLIKKGYSIENVQMDTINVPMIMEIADIAQAPLRTFLIKHAHLKDRDMFYKLAWRMREPRDRAELTDEDWTIIVPAFVISELKEAFQIGFILFVPFLVIDMVVANILMALGMQMLSPTTISLPFKVLLFVLVDGWYLITKGLVIGYQ